MAIIVVGGSNRGVGKTTLVCGLIAAVSPGGINPSGRKVREARAPFFRQIFERQPAEVAARPEPVQASNPIWQETTPGEDTDTGRYLAAGAMRALLVTAPDGGLGEVLNHLWPRFGRGSNILFESNSVAHHVRADVCLLIHAVAERELPLPERKPSFLSALRHADALVARAGTNKVVEHGLCVAGGDEQAALRPIFQLRSLEQVSPELLDWLHLQLPAPLHF